MEGALDGIRGVFLLMASSAAVIAQIVVLDLVFSLDRITTAMGVADYVPVMVAAIVVAIVVMMVAASPIANFIENHPSTKMLALAFLLMVGMALVADGFHFHLERGFIYAAMVFAGALVALNLRKQRLAALADRGTPMA